MNKITNIKRYNVKYSYNNATGSNIYFRLLHLFLEWPKLDRLSPDLKELFNGFSFIGALTIPATLLFNKALFFLDCINYKLNSISVFYVFTLELIPLCAFFCNLFLIYRVTFATYHVFRPQIYKKDWHRKNDA